MAFYIDGTFELSDKTTISAGFRNTEDEKTFSRFQYGTAANPIGSTIQLSEFTSPFGNPLPESAYGTRIADGFGQDTKTAREPFDTTQTWKADTWRFLVEHNISDDIMVYGSISKGFVSGGFAETCGSVLSCGSYSPEESESTEIGIKGDFYDGRLRMNAALFSVDYDALIRSQVVTVTDAAGKEFQETMIVNNGSSKAQGLELEATWLPNDNFRLDFNLGYLDHEYEEYNLFDMAGLGAPAGSAAEARTVLDLSSLEVPFSPELNYGIAATYDQSLANGSSVTYNLNAHYQDSYETMPFPANGQGLDASGNFILKQKANTNGEERTIVNGSITYQADDNLSLTVYGKNLTDDVHRINGNAVATLWVFTQYGAPRELGFKVAYDF
jgi:iron complex outermembrane receptor protein